MGLAFNVKLFQGLVPLPALALFGALVCHERRVLRPCRASPVRAVALAWLTLTLLVPASDRPYAIGSTNGSAWKRRSSTTAGTGSPAPRPPRRRAPRRRRTTASRPLGTADHRALAAAALRAQRPALGPAARLRAASRTGARGAGAAWSAIRPRGPDDIERAFAIAMLSWLAIGFALYSAMERLHPRYTEGFTPAVAAAAGIGVAWALRDGLWQRLGAIVAAVALAVYGRWLLGGPATTGAARAGAIVAAVAAALPTWRVRGRCSRRVSPSRRSHCRWTSTTA